MSFGPSVVQNSIVGKYNVGQPSHNVVVALSHCTLQTAVTDFVMSFVYFIQQQSGYSRCVSLKYYGADPA